MKHITVGEKENVTWIHAIVTNLNVMEENIYD